MTQQQTAGGDVRLTGLSKTYGSFTAVRPLDLTVPQGSFFAALEWAQVPGWVAERFWTVLVW